MNVIDIIYVVYTVQYIHYTITSLHVTPCVPWKMDFWLDARGAARGRKRASIPVKFRGDAELWWIWTGVRSHILSGDQNFKKSVPSAQEDRAEFTSTYSVVSICRKWHMSHLGFCRCRRTGSRLVSHLTAPEDTTRHPLTDKSQDKSKRGDRARLVSHHDKRQELCERYHSHSARHKNTQLQFFSKHVKVHPKHKNITHILSCRAFGLPRL